LSAGRAAVAGLALALAISFAAGVAKSVEPAAPEAAEMEPARSYGKHAKDASITSRKYLGNAGAEELSDAELIPALILALDQISKYHRMVASPEIIRAPHERIEEMVCRAKCAALATYRPGEGIYLDDRLRPETNLFDRSILLHELVHYAQDMNGEHDDMRPCMRWYQREQEAYAIQKIFLGMTGSPTRVAYSAHKSTCDDEPKSVAAPVPAK
jgi:hypothetical protein